MEWLGPVAEILDDLGAPWVIAGAVAAFAYRAEGRFTTDLDLLVAWHEELPSAMERLGYEVKIMADPGEHPHLLLLRKGSERVDLIIPTVPYQEQAIERGRADRRLTVEDVIVHKLLAWRPRDRDDIASILEAGHDLDQTYIEHWADEWEVAARWAEAQGWR